MIIFSDFDGTIAQNDVGNLLARTFGDAASCAEAVAAWKRDEISSLQCIERESATIRVTQFQLEAFCDRQMLSNGFVKFAALCRSRAWPLIVLSDGWDYYIQRILARHGLTLPVYSNHLRFAPPDRLLVEFPYREHSCGRCANCKGYQVRRRRHNHEQIVYIGDGFSDRCGAREADLIFAKGELADWLQKEQITHHRFEDFVEIAAVLEEKPGNNMRIH
ncbi:MtnX-like HAD-IB family phosphatase [candidate division KSB1 bacterium]|nr:MtnX-like HAD-IB family phosphatase [candidate division KSB1 bacterium]